VTSFDFDPDRVETVTFDSYSTLLDVGSAARALEGVVADPDAVAAEWRRSALEYSLVAGRLDAYETYDDLHRRGLEYALAAAGVELPDERVAEINAVYHDLEPFDDVQRGFRRLAAAGYTPSVLSNGDPAMLESLVASTGIADHVHTVISADELRTFKPDAALYEHAADRVDTRIEGIAHVAAHWMDVQGAGHAGMQGVWIDRAGEPWPTFDGEPALTIDTVDELCDRLEA
jgi:2-haloacid dehalogenase